MRSCGAIGAAVLPKKILGEGHDALLRYSKTSGYDFYPDAIRIPYQAEGIGRTDDAMWGMHKGTNKVYKPHPLGKVPEDWWPMNILNANDPERVGYPTQKPLNLLDRIIKASSNEGDMILDPFAGLPPPPVLPPNGSDPSMGRHRHIQESGDLVQVRIRKEINLFHNFKPIRRSDIPRRTDLGKLPQLQDTQTLAFRKAGRALCRMQGFVPIPQSHRGSRHPSEPRRTDHMENLQLLCGACNSMKGTGTQAELVVKLQAQELR